MKGKAGKNGDAEPMLSVYDFSKGVRGKYAERFRQGTNLVLIDSDLSRVFPDSAAVNSALRVLANAARLEVRKPSRPRTASAGRKTRAG